MYTREQNNKQFAKCILGNSTINHITFKRHYKQSAFGITRSVVDALYTKSSFNIQPSH